MAIVKLNPGERAIVGCFVVKGKREGEVFYLTNCELTDLNSLGLLEIIKGKRILSVNATVIIDEDDNIVDWQDNETPTINVTHGRWI